MGKSRFDGTKRLAFPPWQRFICIHSDRPVPEIDEGRLEFILRSDLQVHRALSLFALFGHKTTERVLKDNDWRDVTRTFEIGELRGSELLSTDSGLSRWVKVVAFGWETGWRPILKLLVPTLAKQASIYRPPAQPAAWIKKKFCEAFTQFLRRCRSSALTKKKVSRQHEQAETNLIIHFARKRWLRHRLPSANPLEPRCAPADFAETWYPD